jgi:hypothetical protein
MIHLEGIEAQVQNLQANMVICHEFEVAGGSPKRRIFSRTERSAPEGGFFGKHGALLDDLVGTARHVKSFQIRDMT